MKKKLSTYSNPKTHKKYNLLIKNNLKVKHNPKTAKFYYTGKDLSNLGFISSSGGSNINADYFNIFSSSSFKYFKIHEVFLASIHGLAGSREKSVV